MNGKRDHKCSVVFSIVGVALLIFGGCGQGGHAGSISSGTASVAVMALSASDVANVTVTISATDIPNPIVVALVASGGMWGGTVSQIPAGSNRTFTLSARDPAGVEQYRGTAIGVTIAAGQTTTIVITAQQVTPPPPHNNAAPVIDALVASALTVAPGSAISLAVTAHDPNPGDTLSYAWSAAAGTFTASSAPSTNWTAPPTAGTAHITIDVQDQLNAHATMSLDVVVVADYGQGAANITVSLNTWPVVSNVSADPARVDAGQTVVLNVVVTDSDGDTLAYLWSCDCQGTFSDTTVSSPSFTLAAVPTSNACTFTVTVEDGKGGGDTGSIAIAAGPLPAVAVPPVILSAYQSTNSADAGQAITMSVQAVDPNGGALSFAWTAAQGTLGQPSTTGSTSQIAWTAPTPFTASATIQVTVTDAMGQVTVEALEVEPYFPGANPDAAAGAGTVALFHFDGINGSTVLSDSSGTGKIATIAGNPVISTAQSRFGGASLLVDGTSVSETNYVSVDGGDDFTFTGDFTIDWWQYVLSYTNSFGSFVDVLTAEDKNTCAYCAGMAWDPSGFHFINYPQDIVSAPTQDAWHHVALTRAGSAFRAFIDGQLVATDSSTATIRGLLRVTGTAGNPDNGDFNGYIDELRVVKGTAVWTSNFTPPTAPYASTATPSPDAGAPDAAGGSAMDAVAQEQNLLLWLNAATITGLADGASVTRWSDGSGNGKDVSAAGVPPTYRSNQINGLPIVRFDGSDDELSTAANFSLSGDPSFTVTLVANISSENSPSTGPVIWDFGDTSQPHGGMCLQWRSSTVEVETGYWYQIYPPVSSFVPLTDVPSIITIRRTPGALAQTTEMFFNGVKQAVTGPEDAETMVDDLFYVGSWRGQRSVADIAELLAFGSALTDADRVALECSLGAKYAISLDASLGCAGRAGGNPVLPFCPPREAQTVWVPPYCR